MGKQTLLRHVATGQYLAAGGHWAPDARSGLVFDDARVAARLIHRLGCEPAAFELVCLTDARAA